MAAAVDNWDTFEQGATWTYGFMVYHPLVDGDGNAILDDDGNVQPDLDNPVDFAGASARLQVRRRVNSSTFYLEALTGTYDEDDAPHAGRIALNSGGTLGRVDIVLTDEDTMAVTTEDAVYDLEVQFPIQSGEIRARVERILEGTITNTLNVTRDEVP